MLTVFEQVAILFVFILTGHVLCKGKVVSYENSGILSSLLIYVFFPCKIFKTFAMDLTMEYLKENYMLLLLSTAITVVFAVGMRLLSKLLTKEKYERAIYEYSLVVPNYAYMGYALAEELLGQAGLLDFMVCALPVTIYIYTVGFSILTKRPMQLKKLVNPVVVALVLGVIVALAQIPMPGIVQTVLTKASRCLSPVSMILTGMVIAQFRFRQIMKNRNIYIVSILLMVVLPLLVGGLLSLFCDMETVQVFVLLFSLPCGLNTIVFPRMIHEDCRPGAGLALVSSVLSCATIPVVCSLFQIGG